MGTRHCGAEAAAAHSIVDVCGVLGEPASLEGAGAVRLLGWQFPFVLIPKHRLEMDLMPVPIRTRNRRMYLPALALLLVLVAGLPSHRAAPTAAAAAAHTYRNPVFAQDFPDPMVLRVGADYYAYGTTTGWEPSGHLFPILHSRDLVHWRYVADAMGTSPMWGNNDWWAPSVIAHDGIYYMYFVGVGLKAGGHCLGVATATTPTGPFKDRGIVACADAKGDGYIDPAPFIDAGGKAYLYLSVDNPYHNISVLPLSADLLRATGPRKELFTLSQAWEHGTQFSTVEGPFMVKHGALYWLFYSGNDWQHDYAVGVATARSPLGPFTKYPNNPILHNVRGVTGPGGGSLFQDARGSWWLAYHAWTGGPGYDAGGVRNLRIDPLRWRGDTASVRGPTTDTEPAPAS